VALGWERAQRRLVAHQPDVPERIDEPTLPMSSPGRLVIRDVVKTAGCACCQGACDHRVRVVAEHLDLTVVVPISWGLFQPFLAG